ncbi:Ribosomal RNA-processing protein 8 [Intoshia linei]|uniref:Ribosomal RNA-processing protein 8 n=1 Tax=Intoshia linei TaxID=1819745 RepID=A0A177BCF6_9BILA|nr:Ribosomal RNA-processing protein 8 [Intoshia linei]
MDDIPEILKSTIKKRRIRKNKVINKKNDGIRNKWGKKNITKNSGSFRMLNEMLYCESSKKSLKFLKKYPDLFQVYHDEFTNQTKNWPVHPLNQIIEDVEIILKNGMVIADMGCGDAKLSLKFSNIAKVHSFDLIPINNRVTACDISKTPLKNDSVDVVVFCLSLMSKKPENFLFESNRILKIGGKIFIAEVESRLPKLKSNKPNINRFINNIQNYGFKENKIYRNTFDGYFVYLAFTKISKSTKMVPLELTNCIYKKR